jgi:predicted MFS family arabinose efflux permease
LDFTLYVGMGLCLAMALLALFLPHTQPGARRKKDTPGAHPAYLPAVRQLLHNPAYLVVLVSYFLVSGSFALVTFYSPPFLEEMGMRREWIGPAQAIGVVFEIALFQLQPALIRRWNIVRTIILGCLALVVRNLMFSSLSNVWALAFSYILAGMFVVFYHIGISMLVNHLAGQSVRATAQTMMAVCSQGLGPMFANWMAGRLAAAYGDNLRPVFLFATLLAMLATLLIAACSRQFRMPEAPLK